MDYKKEYEEAMFRMNKWVEGSEIVDPKQVAEFVFPELKESEDEKIRKDLINFLKSPFVNESIVDEKVNPWIAWLEKKGEQEQLYIRFGEIPTDEKSKIYQGEIEVGTENGVSVYPAFRTDEGNIVLGLSLPITKTTLYTQQHLIEYDDRPCYLVKGDYVGKDTDGQPLINNVGIIKKIDNYRVKEEKQGEQKPTDKIEPKFKVGDWIANGKFTWYIKEFKNNLYRLIFSDGTEVCDTISFVKRNFHLWTIKDAKDGDVLSFNDGHGNDCIELIKSITDLNKDKKIEFWFCLTNNEIYEVFDGICPYTNMTSRQNAAPATKEQRDLLFQKMKEAGYEWDADKKELRRVEQKPYPETLDEAINLYYYSYGNGNGYFENLSFEKFKDIVKTFVNDYSKQNPAWSEEDEKQLNDIISLLPGLDIRHNWLKSLKERMKGEMTR